jgi:hypothetical protein
MVAPTLAFVGVVYRAGQITSAIKAMQGQIEDNGRRISNVERWIQNRANGRPGRERGGR